MSTESAHGGYWGHCHVRGCRWEGPIRTSSQQAHDDETEHLRERHPRIARIIRMGRED